MFHGDTPCSVVLHNLARCSILSKAAWSWAIGPQPFKSWCSLSSDISTTSKMLHGSHPCGHARCVASCFTIRHAAACCHIVCTIGQAAPYVSPSLYMLLNHFQFQLHQTLQQSTIVPCTTKMHICSNCLWFAKSFFLFLLLLKSLMQKLQGFQI